MALDAVNRTKATAISRTKTIRMAETLLFRVRRAERMVGGQPCRAVIARKPLCGKRGAHIPLAKAGRTGYLKREPRHLL